MLLHFVTNPFTLAYHLLTIFVYYNNSQDTKMLHVIFFSAIFPFTTFLLAVVHQFRLTDLCRLERKLKCIGNKKEKGGRGRERFLWQTSLMTPGVLLLPFTFLYLTKPHLNEIIPYDIHFWIIIFSGILNCDRSLNTWVYLTGIPYNILHCTFLWYDGASSSSSLHAIVTMFHKWKGFQTWIADGCK